VRIARLDAFPWFVPQLADLFAVEWPEWAATVSREELESGFACAPEPAKLPVVLVAFEEDRLLGTIALRHWFGDAPMAETPWVRGLYVVPEARGKRVGPGLIEAVEEEAKRRGYQSIHAATTRIESYLVKQGWEVFRRVDQGGEPMAWLRRALA
jgi:GNAT superfamily N-acetyltransferase